MQGKVIQYSNQVVNVFNDRNYPAYPNHDLFVNAIFVNKHVQPSQDPCLNDLMHYVYGRIDGVSVARYVTAMHQTGDMHIAIYDRNNEYLYVANAGVADANGNASPAYTAQFLRFDAAALWSTNLSDYA